MSASMSPEQRDRFDSLLEKVLDELPDEVQELLESVSIIVEDEPSRRLLRELGRDLEAGESDLCGLHTGVPLSEVSVLDSGVLPSQIFLFRGPIYRLSGRGKRSLEKEIRITLLHEIGHHFGFSEEKLEDLGYE